MIEGGAYPAKAAVGEQFPIRATVFREGHDAVNATVVLTAPDGTEHAVADATRRPRSASTGGPPRSPSTPRDRGPSGSRAGATRGRPGSTTPRSRSRPASTSPWSAPRARRCSPRRPTGPRPPATPRRPRCCAARPRAWTPPSRSRTGWRSCWPTTSAPRWRRYGPRELVSPTPDYPIFVRPQAALFASWYEFFPRSQGAELRRGDRDLDLRHLRLLPRAARGGRRDGLRRGLPAADPPDRHARSARAATTP